MKLKDARILWNCNDKGEITDIGIYEFNKENGSFEKNLCLHDRFRFDEGNAHSDWKQWDVGMVLAKFLFWMKFANNEAEKFRREMEKIDEFKYINDFLSEKIY